MDQEQKKQTVILVVLVAVAAIVGYKVFGGGGGESQPAPVPDGVNAAATDTTATTATGATATGGGGGESQPVTTAGSLEFSASVAEYQLVSAGSADPLRRPGRLSGTRIGDTPPAVFTIRSVRNVGSGYVVQFKELRGAFVEGEEFDHDGATWRVLAITRGVVEVKDVVTGSIERATRGGSGGGLGGG